MPMCVIVRFAEERTMAPMPVTMTLFTTIYLAAVVMAKPITILRYAVSGAVVPIPIVPTNLPSRFWMTSVLSLFVISGSTVNATTWTIPVSGTKSASVKCALLSTRRIITGLTEDSTVFPKPVGKTLFSSSPIVTSVMTY